MLLKNAPSSVPIQNFLFLCSYSSDNSCKRQSLSLLFRYIRHFPRSSNFRHSEHFRIWTSRLLIQKFWFKAVCSTNFVPLQTLESSQNSELFSCQVPLASSQSGTGPSFQRLSEGSCQELLGLFHLLDCLDCLCSLTGFLPISDATVFKLFFSL